MKMLILIKYIMDLTYVNNLNCLYDIMVFVKDDFIILKLILNHIHIVIIKYYLL